MMFKSSLAPEIQTYLDLRSPFYADKSVDYTRRTLHQLDQYLCSCGFQSKVLTEEILNAWISSLPERNRKNKNLILSVRGFVKYLNALGNESFLPEPIRVKSDYIPYIYSDEDIRQIFFYADRLPERKAGYRKTYQFIVPMALRILYGCGTRIGETMALRRRDVDFKAGTLFLEHTKFAKERLIPVHETLLSILERYCLAMGIMYEPDAYLFPGRKKGTHLCTRQMDAWFSEILKLGNINQREKAPGERGACIHCLRHLFVIKAVQQLEEKGHPIHLDDLLLPTYLGHEHLLDTDKYMRFSGVQDSSSLEAFESYSAGLIPDVEMPDEEE